MLKLNMLSNNFSHDKGATHDKPPKKIQWSFNSYENPISVYVDNDFHNGIRDNKSDGKSKKKFLWLLESKMFDGGASENIKNNLDDVLETFEEIWTHNEELLLLSDKFKWSPANGSWIKNSGIHPKYKMVSMITSNKTFTPQHKIRYDFATKIKNNIDVFGRGFNEIRNKEIGLNDYRFSFAFENDTYDTYFTEKILDCFATGTIPIYMGTKNISKYFNENGIIFFDGTFDLSILTEELYMSKKESIQDNYERVQNYDILDDWIFETYLKKYV